MSVIAAAHDNLTAGFFPAGERRRTSPAWRSVALGIVIVVLVAGIQLLRLPGDASINTIWAEDGRIFLQDAKSVGSLGALLHTYNGYVHLVPRLIAAVVASFPLAAAAALFAVLSAVVVGLVALLVFVASRDHIPSARWRLALCAALAFMPVAGAESLDNSANLQWYLIAGAFWALLWRPRSLGGRLAQFLVCFLAAGSEPLAVLLVPVAAARVVATRSPGEHAPTLGLLAGLALQLVVGTITPAAGGHPGILFLGRLYAVRVLVPMVLGDRGDKALFARMGWTPAYVIAGLLLVAACVWAARTRRQGGAWVLLGFGVTSLLLFSVPVWLRWGPGFIPTPSTTANLSMAARYTVVPIFLLYSLVACALGGRWHRPRVPGLRVAAVGLVAGAAMTTWTLDFSATHNARTEAPRWDRELQAAQATCATTQRPAVVTIDIAPGGWTVELPCRDVLQGASARG